MPAYKGTHGAMHSADYVVSMVHVALPESVEKESLAPKSSKPATLSAATPPENMMRHGSTLTFSFTVKKGASCTAHHHGTPALDSAIDHDSLKTPSSRAFAPACAHLLLA